MPVKKDLPKQIYRSETNRILAGVAGGLGDYFDIDPVIFRIIFVLLTVFGGSGILIYIILWILIPDESSSELKSDEAIRKNAREMKDKAKRFADDIGMSSKDSSGSWIGIIIVVLGILFLSDNLGFLKFNLLWPLIIIVFGLWLLVKER